MHKDENLIRTIKLLEVAEFLDPVHSSFKSGVKGMLKVPKREIFDRSDFPDFYTIKSLRVGNFGVKIKKFL